MAQHKSAIRQRRKTLRRTAINQKNKSALRTQIRSLREAIKSKNAEEAQKLLPETFSIIDRSVKKGAIHKNKGNRHKSRLTHQIELISPSPSK